MNLSDSNNPSTDEPNPSVLILQNQDGYFLSKSGQWLDGREPAALYRTVHRDEAVNQLFEANSQDYNLRISILSCDINSKKHPLIPDDILPPPLENPESEVISNEIDHTSTNNNEYNSEFSLTSGQHIL